MFFIPVKETNRLISEGMYKVQGIFGETLILVLSSSAVFRLQSRISDFL